MYVFLVLKRPGSVAIQYLCKWPTKCLSKLLNRVLRGWHQASIVFTVNDSTQAIESINSDLQRIRNPEKTKPIAFWYPNNIFEITGI